MKPTDKEVKEFWKWCDWEYDENVDYWYPPGDVRDSAGLYITYSSLEMADMIDLNNLFKYAVPKAITILIVANGIDEYEAMRIIFAKWLEKFKGGYSFADALFWALDKVREE